MVRALKNVPKSAFNFAVESFGRQSQGRMGHRTAAFYSLLACGGRFGIINDLARLNTFADSAAFGNSQLIVILQIEPKLRGQAKIPSQANGSVGANGPLSTDDLINARKIQGFCQCISADAH